MTLLQQDWKKQHVYLVQYPRCRTLPNLSPWSFKLETWLRMAGIPFTNINNEFKHFSEKGQVPFIELNGQQIAESNIIIEALKKEFANEEMSPSSPNEQALARAITALIEDHLSWALLSLRSKLGFEFLLSDDGFGRHYGNGITKPLLKMIIRLMMGRNLNNKAMAHGMGRNTTEELFDIARDDLKAISTFLGDKPYFFGDRPTTLDATMFGHLAHYVYTPTPDDVLNKYVKESTPNLVQFIERVRENYWPDWEETCSTMDMNAHNKEK